MADLKTLCVIWNRTLDKDGYGRVTRRPNYRHALAHRWAWEMKNGPIPVGFEIDHLCAVRACVNVSHLELVSHAENIRRRDLASGAGRPDRCKHGHLYTADNIQIPGRQRYCRVCNRAACAAYKAAKRISKTTSQVA